MATHSTTLAWKIPWMEEPGRLQSMGSLRVGHYWATSLWLFTFMHWRREWQPTPVFLPGESQGQRSLVGCSPWGGKESDTTEQLTLSLSQDTVILWVRFHVLLSLCPRQVAQNLALNWSQKILVNWTKELDQHLYFHCTVGVAGTWTCFFFPLTGNRDLWVVS